MVYFTVGLVFRLASFGLEDVEEDVLAVQLLTPSAFLVVNIMQLYYFHSGWMNLITMPRYFSFAVFQMNRTKFRSF
jgi:hypothetical protein